MSPMQFGSLPAMFADLLVRASVHALVYVAIVWIVCRSVKSIPAAARCALWWLACIAPLVQVGWWQPAELPLLPASEMPRPLGLLSNGTATDGGTIGLIAPIDTGASGLSTDAGAAVLSTEPGAAVLSTEAGTAVLSTEPGSAVLPTVALVIVLVWLAGFLWSLGRTLVQCRAARGLIRDAVPVTDSLLLERFAGLAERFGLAGRVELRTSSATDSAQVAGFLRPVVVLPERDVAALDNEALELTLAHELLHIRRGDLWLGWLPVVAQRLFWFHPAVALALREYVLAREAACDAHVLEALDASPRTYGRLLLDLGIVRRETGAVAIGMAPSPKVLERRLGMLLQTSESGGGRSRWWWMVLVAALVGTIPFRVVAVGPKAGSAVKEKTTTSTTTNTSTSTSTSTSSNSNDGKKSKGHSWSYSTDDDGRSGRGFVFVRGDGKDAMSGTSKDWQLAKRLQEEDGRPMLLFREDDTVWVIRDPALVDEADRLLEPQRQLGSQQGELGARQGELGAKQGELGAQQGVLGQEQARLAQKQARLSVRQSSDDLSEAERAELAEKMRDLSEEQAALGERQRALGEKQSALGEKQSALGEQQSALGKRQQEAAEIAQPKLWQLLERARSTGVAEKVEG